jgi:hypothetical protein
MTGAALSRELFVDAVRAAIRAPSILNSQPWRFRRTGAGMEVLVDEKRKLPVADPTGWAARVACGAATANATLALAASGVQVDVLLCPDAADQEVVARLVPAATRPPTPREAALYAAIRHRHSDRHPFEETAVPAESRIALRTAAREHGAWLELLMGEVPVCLVAEIVRAADTARLRDAAYVHEVDFWVREPGAVEGIVIEADGSVLHGQVYEQDPLVAVLGTARDTVRDQLVAGIALEYVLLTATNAGLATSLLSRPIEVSAAREELRRGLGRHGVPQIVVRLGYGRPSLPTARRPVNEAIDG